MEIRLMCVDAAIADELADPKCTKKQIAESYALAIAMGDHPKWDAINKAIIDRWGLAGLQAVKRLAWKRVAQERAK